MKDTIVQTPIGNLEIKTRKGKLTGLSWTKKAKTELKTESKKINRQLIQYFKGDRKKIEFPITANGTPFQKKVWKAISSIKYGKTTTYGDIAKKISSSPRAVGQAAKRNPLLILIPCHRVVAKNSLGGFLCKCGVRKKEKLLRIEKIN